MPPAPARAEHGEEGIVGGWDARGFWMSPWEGVPDTWVQRSLCEPPYLAGGSRGNSRRLAASSSVRKTGVIWTLGGSAAPRSAEQRGQGPLWAREDGEGGRKCSWGDASSPQAGPGSSSGLRPPEQKPQSCNYGFCHQQEKPTWATLLPEGRLVEEN